MKLRTKIILATFLSVGTQIALADVPTKTEIVAQVNAAVAAFKKVGRDQMLQDINTQPAWKVKGMNVLVNDANVVISASSLNPKLVGKNLLNAKDPNGKEFAKECVTLAKRSEGGWVEYQFMNPESKQIEERHMFCHALPGSDLIVSVAASKQ